MSFLSGLILGAISILCWFSFEDDFIVVDNMIVRYKKRLYKLVEIKGE